MPTLRALALITSIVAGSCDQGTDSPTRGESDQPSRRVLDALSDGLELDRMRAQLADLWPIHPRHEAALHAWLREAEVLVRRVAAHREIAQGLRSRALPYSDTDGANDYASHPRRRELDVARERLLLARQSGDGDAAAAAQLEVDRLEPLCRVRRTWRFELPRDEWLQRRFVELLDGLATFEKDVENARWRVQQLARLRAFAPQDRAVWRAAKEAGLAIPPQFGLVPIGRDPQTGLWEFAVRSSGAVPERDAKGRLERSETMAIVLVLVPGGTAKIGAVTAIQPAAKAGAGPPADPDAQAIERPVHTVRLDPFLVGKFEVTQAQWKAMTGRMPSEYGPSVAYEKVRHTTLHPVERVSWHECRDVLRRFGMDLPTEVQWEYAARAGTSTAWSSGQAKESLRGRANLADRTAARYNASWAGVHDWPDFDDGYCLHSPCGAFLPNPWGLHDVHGNVWEWCRDNHGSYELPARPGDGFREVHDAELKAVRGGSYNMPASAARCANRGVDPEHLQSNMVGLRAVAAIQR